MEFPRGNSLAPHHVLQNENSAEGSAAVCELENLRVQILQFFLPALTTVTLKYFSHGFIGME